ncbi:MAG: hypothetical protein KKH92_05750 [Firmicutes bacterium]|nr:hypothetical protein [Bacillota bacterium]
MNKRVYNKTLGKIVRTLGFLLILVSSTFLSAKMILGYQDLPLISNVLPYANMINDFVAPYPFIDEYALVGLVAGLIMLLWAIRRGLILRVVLTVVLAFVLIEGTISGTSPLFPITLSSPAWVATVLGLVSPIIDLLNGISIYIIPGAAVAVPFLLWVLFAYKKPNRFSIFMLRLGSITLFLAVAMFAAKQFVASLNDVEIFNTINIVLYLLTYLFYVLGSAFGVLGFARK